MLIIERKSGEYNLFNGYRAVLSEENLIQYVLVLDLSGAIVLESKQL
jgi:hypothetical protein